MKRVAAVAISVLAILVVIALRCRGSRSSTSADPDRTAHSVRSSHPRPDPARLVRGSLAGTVTDETKRPVAGAHVCADGRSQDLSAELFRDARCAITDARGAYTIEHLLPANYAVSAWARTFKPAVHEHVVLLAGDHAPAIDLVLASGGVEITGTVIDVTGGTIAHARVSASAWHDRLATPAIATTEADDHGGFSLWLTPGRGEVSATAEGYTDGHTWVDAPATIEIRMTPEATLAGLVVDAATGEPVDGARVELEEGEWHGRDQATLSDASGAFRFTRLVPGRFSTVARTDRGYGRSEGTSLVALGQHVEGIAIRMFPAQSVEGEVVIGQAKARCEDAYVTLTNPSDPDRWAVLVNTGGRMRGEGVLPGTYVPRVWCHHSPSRAVYPPVIVADRDVSGVVWPVAIGGTVRGRVVTTAGAPVEGESVAIGQGQGMADAVQQAGPGGAFEFAGVSPGDYELRSHKTTEAITVAEGGVVQRDLVIAVSGTIQGTVVDRDGKPIAHLELLAVSTSDVEGRPVYAGGTSDQRGAFTMRSVPPGEYYLAVALDAFDHTKPHETTLVVRADQVATGRLVIAAKQGIIQGTVVDERAQPISDAYVVAVPQPQGVSDVEMYARFSFDDPAVTATDGTFSLPVLATGEYLLHAQRKGGGEVFLGHIVAGSTVTLQIHATASIIGTVRGAGGTPPEQMTVEVSDPTGFDRREQLFQTAGRYAIRDLPKGKYKLSIEAADGWKMIDLELAEGETRTADLVLGALVTVSARLVDARTHQPVAGIAMTASSAAPSPTFAAHAATTDAAGRFTFLRVPLGALTIDASSSGDEGYHEAEAVRDVAGPGDLGDITIVRARSAGNDPVGLLGFDDSVTEPYRVRRIDPDGPAAKTALVVGDVITSVDGTDVTGSNHASYTALVTAPPGTTLVLGLARGATVTITLAAPPPD